MKSIAKFFEPRAAFLSDESGVVAADYIVITAALAGLAIVIVSGIAIETGDLAGGISSMVESVPVDGS